MRWEIQTIGYSYALFDTEGDELVAYQWDPSGDSSVRTPHVHIGKALVDPDLPVAFRRRFSRLARAHLPTGFIPLTAILRVAIDDFGAEPLRRMRYDLSVVDQIGIERAFSEAEQALRASFDWQSR